jgi:large exoprotein involved in heme utilization and adhesion
MEIRVTDTFEISGQSRIDGAFSGLYAETQGSGRGGNIDVRADALELNRGLIRSSTAGSGRAGSIRIAAGDIVLANGGWIDAGTTGGSAGDGGSIELNASRSLLLTGVDRTPAAEITPPVGVLVTPAKLGRPQGPAPSAISSNTAGRGAGGNLTLVSPHVTIADGARISANSSGSATAGSIRVDARPGSLMLDGASITTQAQSSDGGNIEVLAGNRVHIRNGEISTSVGSGGGSGGNLFIDPTFVILERARASANAFGGSGGNVDIRSGYFFATPDSTIEASSQLGVSGSVQISAVQADVVAALPVLPAQFYDAGALLREACAPRANGASRLVDVGRGGLSVPLTGYMPSRYFEDATPQSRGEAAVPAGAREPALGSVLLAGACRPESP